jgi:hypothetical protein
MCVPFVSNSVTRVYGRAVVSGLLFSAAAHAASIDWGNVQDISGPGTTTVITTKTDGGPGNNQTINNGTNDVNEQGTMVLGVNFSGQPGTSFPFTTTIDSQNFYSYVDLPGPSGSPAYPVTFNRGTLNNQYNGYTPGPSGQAYGVFDTGGGDPNGNPPNNQDFTLANALFGNSTTAAFSVGNLTPGAEYLLQFWVSDPRNATTVFRQETVSSSTGGDTNIPTLEYEGNGTDGQWVTGTFTADASMAETFDLSASNSNESGNGDSGSPQVNLFQLRQLTGVSLPPPPPQWALTGAGDWNSKASWSTGVVPDGVDAEADFFGSITANHTVYNDASTPITVGILNFNNTNTYVLAGAGSLTLQTSTGNAQVIVQAGTQEINLPLTIASNTVLNVSSGATLVMGNPITINSGLSLTQTGSGTVTYESTITVGSSSSIAFGNSTHAHALTLQSSSSASIGGTGTVLTLDSLSLAGGAKLDIGKGQAQITYTGSGPASAIALELKTAYANGTWTGSGITSSSASFAQGTSVGYFDTGTQVNIERTWIGDLNLDGVVNSADFALLGTAGGGWQHGDLNYDGVVNADDYSLFDYGAAIAGSRNINTVPEPGVLGLVLAAGLVVRRRCRARI